MYLTRHETSGGSRWALDQHWLPEAFELGMALQVPSASLAQLLRTLVTKEAAQGALLPPIEPTQEVWASGVTYLRSREAREAESTERDVYAKVYTAERPELFFKSTGARVVGPSGPIRVRRDSRWNVPEPELTLVLDSRGEIVGYTVGNDVSSRDIEGENPLYLPQAKVYDGSCALGPGIVLSAAEPLRDLPIHVAIARQGQNVFEGETRTSRITRDLADLAHYLFRELSFPTGAFLLTGTGIVPPPEFSMQSGDVVRIRIAELELENPVS